MIYLFILCALFIVSHASSLISRNDRFLYYPVAVFLFIFVAFRFEVGCDWESYFFQFNAAYWLGWSGAFKDNEPGWWALLYFVSRSNINYVWINVISAVIFFAGIHVLARRQPYPLAFLAFMFPILIINMPMSGIRQGAAIGLLCIAATRIMDGKIFKYVFWVTIAATIHSSAAIFLTIAPLVTRKLKPATRVVIMVVLAIPGIFLLVTGETGQQAFERYVATDYDSYGALYRLILLMLSGVFYLVFLRKKWKAEFPADYHFVTLGAMSMIGVMTLLPLSSVIADRLGYYLIPLQAIIFSRTLAFRTIPFAKLLAVGPSIALMLFFYVWTTNSSHFVSCYRPYQNWLTETPILTRGYRR